MNKQPSPTGPRPNYIPGLVSIITPAYNGEAVLADAVSSVRSQTYANWEMIIVDDCSKDSTLELARELARTDERIRVIGREKNGGAAQAKNEAIRAARGQYVAYLDCDDVWLPQKLKLQIDHMRTYGVGLCYSSFQPFKSAGELLLPVFVPPRLTYSDLLKQNVMGCLTVVVDRAIYPKVPMPTVNYEDYATWLALLRQGGEAHGISEVLAKYRILPNSVSSKKLRSARWVWHIYRQSEGLTVLKSAWYFLHFSTRLITHRLFPARLPVYREVSLTEGS